MPRCPTCSIELAATGGACPACATATATVPLDATRTAEPLNLSGLLHTLTRGLSAPPVSDAGFRFGAGTVRVWETARWQEVAELRGHDKYARSVAFSRDGRKLVTGSGDTTVRVWDSRPDREVVGSK
jgi:hypothetical protein